MPAHRFAMVESWRRVVLAALATVLGTAAPASGATLWNQTDHAAGRGTPSSLQTTVFQSWAGDDFAVPSGERWRVKQVNVDGSYAGSALPVEVFVRFFTSTANGLPDTQVAADTYSPPSGLSDPDFAIPLDTPAGLRGGRTYWLVVQAVYSPPYGQGQWFWTDRTVKRRNGAAWLNPQDGFGTGCTSWGRRAAICRIDPTAPDQIFNLAGRVLLTS